MKLLIRIADEKSDVIQIVMASILIAASVIPLLLLGRYAMPFGDDLSFAIRNIRDVPKEWLYNYTTYHGSYFGHLTMMYNTFSIFGHSAYLPL